MFSLEKHKGFTLLELLVALAILSIVALTALKNNSSMIANASYLRDKTVAHWVAMNKAAELRLAGQLVVDDGQEGKTVMAERRWNWQVTGKATQDPDIQLVNIEVWSELSDKAELSDKGTSLASLSMYLGQQ
ncbi:MAG: type II secretion system minor pseudopilin GspI [Desulfobulbaceae bacterium]|nr:type II secretion system minor pseudopilin GspI [Desulfobulbaceae bacterium]